MVARISPGCPSRSAWRRSVAPAHSTSSIPPARSGAGGRGGGGLAGGLVPPALGQMPPQAQGFLSHSPAMPPSHPAKASRSFPGQHKVCPRGLTSLGWDDGKSLISQAGGRDQCPMAGCGAPTACPLKVPAPSQPTGGILTKSTTHGVHSCRVVTVCPQCPFSDICRGCTHP